MVKFRQEFPTANLWQSEAARPKWKSSIISQAETMEAQRQFEDQNRPLEMEDKHLVKHQKPIVDFLYSLREKLLNHPTDSGVCLILCGKAHTFKCSINRILGHSFAPFSLWPGSQWVQKDLLKYDSAARNGISTQSQQKRWNGLIFNTGQHWKIQSTL